MKGPPPEPGAGSGSSPAVTLEPSLCVGCTTCIRNCPTEAIRVRKGKAHILAERCVDCGNCVRICPHGAKKAVSDPLAAIGDYRLKIALPAPSLYAQFDDRFSRAQIDEGLRALGFDRVEEVAAAADIVSAATDRLLGLPGPRPLISSACPAVLRLVQIRFPSLIPNLAPLLPPMEVAAKIARLEAPGDPAEVGVFFIGPCAGKVRMTREPLGYETSALSGALGIADIYVPLLNAMRKSRTAPAPREEAALVGAVREGLVPSGTGRSWCRPEGEIDGLPGRRAIAANGMDETIALFEELDQDRLTGIEYIEALGCPSGCLGGPLAVENRVVARARIRRAERKAEPRLQAPGALPDEELRWTREIEPRPVLVLDRDIGAAMAMMKRAEEIRSALPGLDCGACGAPSCQALADDVVLDRAVETDCIFRLRQTVQELAQRLFSLTGLRPPGLQGMTDGTAAGGSVKENHMLISELCGRLGLKPIQDEYEDQPVRGGYCSDLLSDVMANAKSGSVLVTIQAHKNSVAVATLVGLSALVLCNGREAPPDMLEAARAEGLAIFGTSASQFEVSGRLWAELHKDAPGGR